MKFLVRNIYLTLAALALGAPALLAEINRMPQATPLKANQSAAQEGSQKNLATHFTQLIDVANCTVLTAADFQTVPGGPLDKTRIIDVPGNYCFGESINFEPTAESIAALEIVANDVIIDLKGNTLRQINDTQDIIGVRLGEEFSETAVFKNITVQNGTILNFTGQGIGALNVAIAVTGEAFENLTFSDLRIFECGSEFNVHFASGIDLDSFADAPNTQIAYKNVTIERCKVNMCLGNGAIEVYTGDGIIVNNTEANELSTTIITTGILAGGAFYGNNIQLSNIQVNGTRGRLSDEILPNVLGLNIFLSKNIQIFTSQFNDTVGEENVASVGSHIDNCNNLYVQDNQFNNTQSLSPIPPTNNNQIAGLFCQRCDNTYFLNVQFNNTFGEANIIVQGVNCSNTFGSVYEKCQFNGTRGGKRASTIAGIHMSDSNDQTTQGNGMQWIKCQFNGTTSDAANIENAPLCGFIAITLKNILFDTCESSFVGTDDLTHTVFGFLLATYPDDPAFPFANNHNISFRNTTTSDLSGHSACIGIAVPVINTNRTPLQGLQANMVFENNIIERIYSTTTTERVAGIAECLYTQENGTTQYPLMRNLFVRGNRISDVRSNVGGTPSSLSAAVLVESVRYPVILENSLSDSDRGILFTGTNNIIPNGFQLAASFADATAAIPKPINIDVPLFVTIDPDPNNINPLQAFYTAQGPRLTAPISAPWQIPVPANACDTVENDLTGTIGIVLADNSCNARIFVPNVEAAGAVATLIIDATGNPESYVGIPTQTKVAVAISQSDGEALLASLTSDTIVTIDSVPTSAQKDTFANLAQGNEVKVVPGQTNSRNDFILPTENLTSLGWQSGDPILYTNGGDNIPTLMSGTTYYAIVYRPGFAEDGLVQDNKVDNCSIAGYQDDRCPTSSVWLNNTAVLNGTPATHCTNYEINWPCKTPQVDKGTKGQYPIDGHKYYNVSLIKDNCEPKKDKKRKAHRS